MERNIRAAICNTANIMRWSWFRPDVSFGPPSECYQKCFSFFVVILEEAVSSTASTADLPVQLY